MKVYIGLSFICYIVFGCMIKKPLCLSCIHLNTITVDGYEYKNRWGTYSWTNSYKSYSCRRLRQGILKLRHRCKHHTPPTQTTLNGGANPMVKIDDIPSEGERYELKDLPSELNLIATEEKIVEGAEGKAGGLQIEFEDPQGKRLTQKYTMVSGAVLTKALKELKVEDTIDLQEVFYTYRLTMMRIGKPRMIPVSKVKA